MKRNKSCRGTSVDNFFTLYNRKGIASGALAAVLFALFAVCSGFDREREGEGAAPRTKKVISIRRPFGREMNAIKGPP